MEIYYLWRLLNLWMGLWVNGFMGGWIGSCQIAENRINLELIQIITSRKGSLRRLCFYTCLSVHRGGGIPACLAGGIPTCLAGLQGGLQANTQGEVEGSGQGVSRPTPGGLRSFNSNSVVMVKINQAHTQGGLQANTQGVSRPTPRRVSPGPHPGCVCIPACTEADTTTPWMAIATGSMHPTGMHSCLILCEHL